MQTTSLRELTNEKHKRAERSKLVHRMLKGAMTEKQYYEYLSNQLMAYYILESYADYKKLFDGIESIKRTTNISNDLRELEQKHGFETIMITDATKRYIDYIQDISADPDKLLAHIYVRHMGDLSGGQIIKRYVPGSGTYYDFSEDVNVLKEKLRSKLNDLMAEEANKCFDMIYEMFEELEENFNDVGSTNKTQG